MLDDNHADNLYDFLRWFLARRKTQQLSEQLFERLSQRKSLSTIHQRSAVSCPLEAAHLKHYKHVYCLFCLFFVCPDKLFTPEVRLRHAMTFWAVQWLGHWPLMQRVRGLILLSPSTFREIFLGPLRTVQLVNWY